MAARKSKTRTSAKKTAARAPSAGKRRAATKTAKAAKPRGRKAGAAKARGKSVAPESHSDPVLVLARSFALRLIR